jgi:hypothetical protein
VPFGQSRSKVQEFFKQSLIYTRLTQTNEVWGNQFVEGGEVDRWIDGKMIHIPSVQSCPDKYNYVKNLMRGAYIHLQSPSQRIDSDLLYKHNQFYKNLSWVEQYKLGMLLDELATQSPFAPKK